jgi:hypothetical protein
MLSRFKTKNVIDRQRNRSQVIINGMLLSSSRSLSVLTTTRSVWDFGLLVQLSSYWSLSLKYLNVLSICSARMKS